MKKFELLELLNNLDDNAEIVISDIEQNNVWDISEIRTCEDNTSKYKNTYADIIINYIN